MKYFVLSLLLLTASMACQGETKRVLEEEFTGTKCGWCPRGIVGIDLCKAKYGNRFIVIAAHGKEYDPTIMTQLSEDAGYSYFLNNTEFPKCKVDRRYTADPYHGNSETGPGIFDLIDKQLASECYADIDVKAEWTNDKSTHVKATAHVKFYKPVDKECTLAYVLTADSLKSDDKNWIQLNYYYDKGNDPTVTQDPNLLPLTKQSKYMRNMVYNHVPIAGKGVEDGISGSLPDSVETNVDYNHSITLEVPDASPYTKIRKEHLHVVAILINKYNGSVLNVAEAAVPQPAGAFVPKSNQNAVVEAIYSLDGRKLTNLCPGVNVLRYTDGSVKKVLVK